MIAKRAFVLYLMTEVITCLQGKNSENGILRRVQGQDNFVELSSDVTLYFYTSFPPCGDATIAEKVSIILSRSTMNIIWSEKFLTRPKPLASCVLEIGRVTLQQIFEA